jgi:hypothetical protein
MGITWLEIMMVASLVVMRVVVVVATLAALWLGLKKLSPKPPGSPSLPAE